MPARSTSQNSCSTGPALWELFRKKCRTAGKRALAYRGKGGQNTDNALLVSRLRVVLYLLGKAIFETFPRFFGVQGRRPGRPFFQIFWDFGPRGPERLMFLAGGLATQDLTACPIRNRVHKWNTKFRTGQSSPKIEFRRRVHSCTM